MTNRLWLLTLKGQGTMDSHRVVGFWLAKVKIQGTKPSCLMKTMGILNVGLFWLFPLKNILSSIVLCKWFWGVCVEKCPLKHLGKLNHILHFRLKELISLSFLFSFLVTNEYSFCYLRVSCFLYASWLLALFRHLNSYLLFIIFMPSHVFF